MRLRVLRAITVACCVAYLWADFTLPAFHGPFMSDVGWEPYASGFGLLPALIVAVAGLGALTPLFRFVWTLGIVNGLLVLATITLYRSILRARYPAYYATSTTLDWGWVVMLPLAVVIMVLPLAAFLLPHLGAPHSTAGNLLDVRASPPGEPTGDTS